VVALDLYTSEFESSDGSAFRSQTEVGQLLQQAKYWNESPGTQAIAREKLGHLLCDLAASYEGFQSVDTVAGIPGHDSNVESLSQSLAIDVSFALDLPLVAVEAREAYRPSLKDQTLDLTGFYFFTEGLRGKTLIVIDDVYETGQSMRVVADAALQAGAQEAFGLVAAKRGVPRRP
jgi:predicted amidophosphoribosyltransferase